MRGLLAILLFSCSFGLSAHEYYFAFAEMKVNAFTQRMEGTIMATEHDLELALQKEGLEMNELNLALTDSVISDYIEGYINQHFEIKTKGFDSKFRLIGFESFLNGQIYLYIESNPIPEEYTSLEVRFDLLMNTFADQQNKLTIYIQGRSYTVPFLKGDTTQLIQIENG